MKPAPVNAGVEFDDFKITHTKSNLIQANEYYPFGLQTANSWTRENAIGNNFLGNGATEINPTSGVYDLLYRNYDPALGRMNQADPVGGKYASWSPYNYSFNSPAMVNDRLGDDPADFYNFVMAIFRNRGSGKIQDTSSGCGAGGGSSGAGADSWANSYNGSGTWTSGIGWVNQTNGESLQTAISYNNSFNSWGNTILGRVSSEENDAGTFIFDNNGETYGGNYHSENGKVTSIAWSSLNEASNGGWLAASQTVISLFGGAVNRADQANNGGSPQFSSSPDISGNQNGFPYNGAGLALNIIGSGFSPLKSEYRQLLNVVTKSSIKGVAIGGKLLGAAGFALTAYQFGSKLADPNQQLSGNDYMDFGVGAGTFVAGLLVVNPVGLAVVIGVGVGYGLYTIWRDDGK